MKLEDILIMIPKLFDFAILVGKVYLGRQSLLCNNDIVINCKIRRDKRAKNGNHISLYRSRLTYNDLSL